jgi:hypothetical protein
VRGRDEKKREEREREKERNGGSSILYQIHNALNSVRKSSNECCICATH